MNYSFDHSIQCRQFMSRCLNDWHVPDNCFGGSTSLTLSLNVVQDGFGSWFCRTNKKARSAADACDLGTSTTGFLNQSAFTFAIFGYVEPQVK